MLSRINTLPRFNCFARQISTNLILSKQYQVKTEPSETRENSTKKSFNEKKFKNDYTKQSDVKKFDNKLKNKTGPELKNLYQNFKITTQNPEAKHSDAKHSSKDVYEKIIQSFKTNQNSYQNLIASCQEMNNLYDQDPNFVESFCSDPIKSIVIDQLIKNIDKMNINEFFTSSQFILRFDPNKCDRIQPLLDSNMKNMNFEQLLKTLSLLRSPQLYKVKLLDTVRNYMNFIREHLDDISNYNQLKLAMRIFSQEANTSKILDNKLLKIAESLKSSDWVDILNNKSILRQRNMTILELCSYKLIQLKEMKIDSIQKCLLSCGILNYYDRQFFKFLVESLSEELLKNNSKEWLKTNEKNLLSIFSSIGMLQLYDEKLLNQIFETLEKNQDMTKLIINYVISCGGLNFRPSNKEKFQSLASKIDVNNFNLNDRKDKINMLNYVWSLCSLDMPNSKLIGEILSEKNLKDLLSVKPEDKKSMKTVLLKLLNINLYSMLCMESYNGSHLPENFRITDYTDVLTPKTIQNNTFVSSLSSYRSLEKYFKLNLLTPFGIFIDALMVVDKNGAPCQLEKFFNQNQVLETSENEFKVAFKLISARDLTMNNNFNGVLTFQIKLLKELGYHPITISHEELKSASLINRVDIIKNKLKDLVKN